MTQLCACALQQAGWIREPGALPSDAPVGFQKWAKHNLKPQAQDGYYTAIVKLPLGDFTSTQGRALADLAQAPYLAQALCEAGIAPEPEEEEAP